MRSPAATLAAALPPGAVAAETAIRITVSRCEGGAPIAGSVLSDAAVERSDKPGVTHESGAGNGRRRRRSLARFSAI